MDYRSRRRRRFQQSSPNTRFLNILLAFATTLCLFNLWVVPSNSNDEDNIIETRSYRSVNRQARLQQQQQQQQPQYNQGEPQPFQLEQTQKYMMAVPLLTKDESHNLVVLAAPESKALMGSARDMEFTDNRAQIQQQQSSQQAAPISSSPNSKKSDFTDTSGREFSVSKSHVHPPKALGTQENAATVRRVLPAVSYRGARKTQTMVAAKTTSPSRILRVALLLVASAALVSGALLAKKALEGVERWEQQSQEDSLAYDMAYTEHQPTMGTPLRNGWTSRVHSGSGGCSDIGYGSFVSTTWSDELEKFDL